MTTEPESNDEEADWMAILLQFLFGAVVGGGVIFYEALRSGFGHAGGHFIIVSAVAALTPLIYWLLTRKG